jgi:rhodanese-related sulfurtransferase
MTLKWRVSSSRDRVSFAACNNCFGEDEHLTWRDRSRDRSRDRRTGMTVTWVGIATLFVLALGGIAVRRMRARREVAEKSIEPEELYALLNAKKVLLYDVRQPLDFVAHAEIIPGAVRIAPKDIADQTASFSRDQESVIYCTGGDEQTSRMVLGKARALNFTRVRLLKGGLAAWKAKGYPVEEYTDAIQLDTAS